MDLKKIIKSQDFIFKTTKTLKKGKYACYCNGKKCKKDAYWRLDNNEYCDRCLPIDGKILFLLNEWKKTDDKELESESSDSDSSSEYTSE